MLRNNIIKYNYQYYRKCMISSSSTTTTTTTTTAINIIKDNKKNNNSILLESDIEEKFVRGYGAGGQSINKTSNMVQLKHTPTGIIVQCQETRELQANRKIARRILREKLEYIALGDDSKIGKKIAKIKKRKYNASRRAKKKYQPKNDENNDKNDVKTKSNVNDSDDDDDDDDSDSNEDDDEDDDENKPKPSN